MKKKWTIVLVVILLIVMFITVYLMNRPGEVDSAALFEAIADGNTESITDLIDEGQDVNVQSDQGLTALQTAITFVQPGIAQLLLAEGADPAPDDAWLTARSMIDPAIDESGINEQMLLLLQDMHDRDESLIYELNDQDETLLFEAVRMRDEKLFNWLAEEGVESEVINISGDTLFHTAARYPYDAVSFVTEATSYSGGKVNSNGDNPMTVAVKSNNPGWIRFFAETDNMNWQNENGWTPLMFAVDYGFTEAAQALLTIGADTDIKNSNGETAADIAANYDNEEINTLLNQY
ncbi:ankyrin repeat domain-containing protein [Jeotgalibacillus terrae]|uniref:Ankyrin repeat domain-containing protein n=1 Tax=Jeotgalibacillus terrae TaxID=587735 RepID=A0ABW5ZKE7_9BACL|nr:ankyrin repeat domain-containing protein [Jeotgalibacillus terrae]MBM7578848.1 ankyrin repeat protein [Jeotgalibacillus terrae]